MNRYISKEFIRRDNIITDCFEEGTQKFVDMLNESIDLVARNLREVG